MCTQKQSTIMKTLKLTLLFCLTTLFAFATISSKEEQALLDLYNTTNGASWNNTWDLEAPMTTWYGVVIQEDKVVELNLEFNNLKGNLPESLGDLIYLKKINFFRNNLTGNIPNSIGNLKSLEECNMAFNSLEGKLPESITNLNALVSLQLFMNQLEGSIPSSIGKLENLEVLELYSNDFSGELPLSICKLSK